LLRTARGHTPTGYSNLNAPGNVRAQHGKDEQQANYETLDIAADIHQTQDILNDGQDKDGEHHA
jgi:hypothetical protein